MSTLSPTSDQLHILENLDDLREHLIAILGKGKLEVSIFSRQLNPRLFNHEEIANTLSRIARSHPLSQVKILIEQPQAIIDANHQLMYLHRRLPSKTSMQKLMIKPQDDYAFVIVDKDKLWLQHKEDDYTGFANYQAAPEVKRFSTLFNDLWKNSEVDNGLRQLTL
jgi:hypothetical protein